MYPTDFSGKGIYNLKFIALDGRYEGIYINFYGNVSRNDLPKDGENQYKSKNKYYESDDAKNARNMFDKLWKGSMMK